MVTRSLSRLVITQFVVLIALGQSWGTADAATPVYADLNLACAGLTPCYATVQEAVDNAGPAPAEVGIFPGIYAESVDLTAMGSNLSGGGPGDIMIQALDAAGQPATSGVEIDPDASGGPGMGSAMTTGENAAFDGDITVQGLTMTSPDTLALGLISTGNLTIQDVAVLGAATDGMLAFAQGNATLARVEARMNAGSGIGSQATGDLTATDLEATQNGETGIALSANENLSVQGLEASGNETGAGFGGCLSIDISNVTTNQNAVNGLLILYGPDDCGTQPTAAAPDFWSNLDSLQFSDRIALNGMGPPAGTLFAETLVSEGNGNVGIGVSSSTGVAQIDGLTANNNAGPGVLIRSRAINLHDAEVIGNASGIAAVADDVLMARVMANQNQPIPPDPMAEGLGIAVSARFAALDDIQANDNSRAGLGLTDAPDDAPDGGLPEYTVTASQFNGNAIGILSESTKAIGVTLDDVTLTSNVAAGLDLPDLSKAAFSNLVVSGSAIGMDLVVNDLLAIETADVQTNATGILLQLAQQATARIGCSSILENGVAGIELAQGASVSASVNYWGDPSGPTHPGNPGGIGDVVVDSANGGTGVVDYSGFLADPASDADCPQPIFEAVPVPTMTPVGMLMLILGLVMIAWLGRSSIRSN